MASEAELAKTAVKGHITITSSTSKTTARQVSIPVEETTTFDLKAYPNPSTSQFTVQISSSDKVEKMQVRVMDISGRTVDVFNNLGANQTIYLGNNYRPGMYIVELIQGKNRKQLKLIKQAD